MTGVLHHWRPQSDRTRSQPGPHDALGCDKVRSGTMSHYDALPGPGYHERAKASWPSGSRGPGR